MLPYSLVVTMTGSRPDTGELMVGGYRLLSLIGEGGMGVVHLAQGADGRRVALKVLRPQVIGDRDARDRLAREVATLESVRSPHIAEMYDADPYAEVPFVVTRYVPGLPLHRYLEDEGPMDEADLRWFAAVLGRAMHDVHRAGVLHRDIKPGNVLMEGRSPVLIDFGLAKVAEDSRLTQTGWLMGTPGYLAPEILYGDDPTTASDVHAWAATVVYAATGRAPYGKGPTMAVLDRVRRGEADLTGVPDSLVPILKAGLSTEPHQRPTVRQILDELDPPSADRTRLLEAAPTTVLPEVPRVAPQMVPQPTSQGTSSLPERYNTQEVAIPRGHTGNVAPAEPVTYRSHKGRQTFGLVGLGAAVTGVVALAPWLGAIAIGLIAITMRWGSVSAERHRLRQHYRGRKRWFDVPVSTMSSPGYLLLSLVGSTLLLGWAAATVIATAGILMLFSIPLWVGLTIAGLVFTACLWWGPGSTRVRRMTRRATEPWARDSQSGIYLGVLGVLLGVVLIATLASRGPIWEPAQDAPWNGGILGQLTRMY